MVYVSIRGIRHVKSPKMRNRREFFLTLSRSISSPARNMIYSSPTLPKSSNDESRVRMSSPFCPITMPANTMPMMCGIRSLPMMMGANNMIISTTKNISVGLVIGKYAVKYSILSAKLQIFLNS